MLSFRGRHANYSVVGCINQHKCLFSVPATEQQKRQWLHFIFNDNMPATLPVVCMCMCVLTTSCQTASVVKLSTKLDLPQC